MLSPDIQLAVGRTISSVKMGGHDDRGHLRIRFRGGSYLDIWDDDQMCCEHRYMTCDAHLPAFKNCMLLGVRLGLVEDADSDFGYHDIQFLIVDTTLGSFTAETHNEHNGYYGGFNVVAKLTEPEERPR